MLKAPMGGMYGTHVCMRCMSCAAARACSPSCGRLAPPSSTTLTSISWKGRPLLHTISSCCSMLHAGAATTRRGAVSGQGFAAAANRHATQEHATPTRAPQRTPLGRARARQQAHADLAAALGHSIGQEELATKQSNGAQHHCSDDTPGAVEASGSSVLARVQQQWQHPRAMFQRHPRHPPAGLCGLPPHERMRRLVRSSVGASGLFTSIATMVEARLVALTRSRSGVGYEGRAGGQQWQGGRAAQSPLASGR